MSLEILVGASAIDSDEENFMCPFVKCRREFTSKRNLLDHCRGNHQGKKPHACTYQGCTKSFLRPAHLAIHIRIHTGEKPFVCTVDGCGKRWNQKSALKQHLRSHTGEKPFGCTSPGCSKKFSTSSSCKRHIATHDRYEVVSKHRMQAIRESFHEPSSPISSSSDEESCLFFHEEVQKNIDTSKMSMKFLLN